MIVGLFSILTGKRCPDGRNHSDAEAQPVFNRTGEWDSVFLGYSVRGPSQPANQHDLARSRHSNSAACSVYPARSRSSLPHVSLSLVHCSGTASTGIGRSMTMDDIGSFSRRTHHQSSATPTAAATGAGTKRMSRVLEVASWCQTTRSAAGRCASTSAGERVWTSWLAMGRRDSRSSVAM